MKLYEYKIEDYILVLTFHDDKSILAEISLEGKSKYWEIVVKSDIKYYFKCNEYCNEIPINLKNKIQKYLDLWNFS